MDIGSIVVLAIVGVLFALALRYCLRHGMSCLGDGCKGGCGCGCQGHGKGGCPAAKMGRKLQALQDK